MVRIALVRFPIASSTLPTESHGCSGPAISAKRGVAPTWVMALAVEVKGRPTRATAAKAEIGQRERQFTPQLLIVQTGTAVSFPNFDTVRHHVYSISPIKVFASMAFGLSWTSAGVSINLNILSADAMECCISE